MAKVILSDGTAVETPFAEKSKKGFSCATCEYLGKDEKTCTNPHYINEHGGNRLGAKAKKFCCLVWTPEGGR